MFKPGTKGLLPQSNDFFYKLRQILRHGIAIQKNVPYTNQYSCKHGIIQGNSNRVKIRQLCEHKMGISVSNFALT